MPGLRLPCSFIENLFLMQEDLPNRVACWGCLVVNVSIVAVAYTFTDLMFLRSVLEFLKTVILLRGIAFEPST